MTAKFEAKEFEAKEKEKRGEETNRLHKLDIQKLTLSPAVVAHPLNPAEAGRPQ